MEKEQLKTKERPKLTAHIGGFITGMVLISLFKNRKKFHSFNLI